MVSVGCLDERGRWVLNFPINFLLRCPGAGPSWCSVGSAWGCAIALMCFIHSVITFSFPLLFVECSWDQRTQKVRPLWPLYQCQGVYFVVRVSLHHFSKLHTLSGPLWLPLSPARAPLITLTVSASAPPPRLVWGWENAAAVGLGLGFKIHANSGKVGCFSWNVWKT